MMANYAQMPCHAIRETVDKQEDGNSVSACGAYDTLGAGNELSPDFHKSPHPFALAGPIVDHFHCVWID